MNQSESQEMESLNQMFQEQLLVNQVPRSVWGVLLSLSPDDYKTVHLERTKWQNPRSKLSLGSSSERSLSSSPQRGPAQFGYYIGRHKSCDVRIQNLHISNRHCLIYRVEADNLSRVYLEDTSTNGTYVNGMRVGNSRSVELHDGDEIQIARYQPEKGMGFFNDRFYVFQDLEVHRQERCLFKQSYYLADNLGKGAFAQVRVAINRVTGARFAAKIIDRKRIAQEEKRKKLDENFQVETSILSRVRHPSIVQVHGVFRESDYLYLVLDLASDGELFDEIIRREFLSEDDSRRVMLQLLLAVRHLNRLGIVHRDIKLENILLEDKQSLRIKLADFGLAKIVGEQMFMRTVCGTPMYVAPEVLTVRQLGVYNNLVDVWSLGVVLYICLCGTPPFSDELSPPPMRDQIIGGMYGFPSPYWDTVSPGAIDMVCRMLQPDPRARISIDDALCHPWLRARCTGSEWSIDGLAFSVADPDALLDDSQRTQSLTADSSQLTSQPIAPYLPVAAPIHTRLPPSSPPTARIDFHQDSEFAFGALASASDSEVQMSVGGASSSTKGLLAIAKANAEINRDALDAANFVGAKGTISRKRKDPSFMRSHSDLGQMALPRRKMNFDLAPANAADNPPHSPFHQRHRRQQPPDIPSAQVSASDPAVLFDMSPDMSRYPSACNNPRDDSGCASGNNDRFGAAHDKQPTAYAGGPFSLYPAPIPRPGRHLP